MQVVTETSACRSDFTNFCKSIAIVSVRFIRGAGSYKAGGPCTSPITATNRASVERDPVAIAGVELGGLRTLLAVPMLKNDELVGFVTI